MFASSSLRQFHWWLWKENQTTESINLRSGAIWMAEQLSKYIWDAEKALLTFALITEIYSDNEAIAAPVLYHRFPQFCSCPVSSPILIFVEKPFCGTSDCVQPILRLQACPRFTWLWGKNIDFSPKEWGNIMSLAKEWSTYAHIPCMPMLTASGLIVHSLRLPYPLLWMEAIMEFWHWTRSHIWIFR